MAQYWTKFNIGDVTINDFTEEWAPAAFEDTLEKIGLPTISVQQNEQMMKIATVTSNARYAVSWDDVPTTNGGKVEIVCLFQFTSGGTSNIFRLFAMGGGGAATERGYFVNFNNSANTAVLAKYNNGVSTPLDQANVTVGVGKWYWTRLQIDNATSTVRARYWREEDPEGSTWHLGGAGFDNTIGDGWVGPGRYDGAGNIWIAYLGVGTFGDVAPINQFETHSRTVEPNTAALAAFDQARSVPSDVSLINQFNRVAGPNTASLAYIDVQKIITAPEAVLQKLDITLTVPSTASTVTDFQQRNVPSSVSLLTQATGTVTVGPNTFSSIAALSRVIPVTADLLEISSTRSVSSSASIEFDEDVDDIITGLAGPISYEFGMLTYDSDGNALTDISAYVSDISISYNSEHSTKKSIEFKVDTTCATLDNSHLVEPFVIVKAYSTRLHAETERYFPLGRYVQTGNKDSIEATGFKRSLEGKDQTIWLNEFHTNETLTFNAGANYSSLIRQLAIDAGFLDQNIVIPSTNLTVPTPLSFEQGISYYKVISTLCDAINWSSPYMTVDNKLTIHVNTDKSLEVPDVLYATDSASMILPAVGISEQLRDIPNAVVIAVNDPLRTPFDVTYYNDNPNNPFSRSVTGQTVTQVFDNLDYIQSATTAAQRAKLEAQNLSAVTSVELKTWLDPRREIFEIYQLYVECPETGNPILTSTWECRSWKMKLEPGAEMTHQLYSVLPV